MLIAKFWVRISAKMRSNSNLAFSFTLLSHFTLQVYSFFFFFIYLLLFYPSQMTNSHNSNSHTDIQMLTFNSLLNVLKSMYLGGRFLVLSLLFTVLVLVVLRLWFPALLSRPTTAATKAPFWPAVTGLAWGLLLFWGIKPIECLPSKDTTCSDINWPLYTI